jgi:hypothetical protein
MCTYESATQSCETALRVARAGIDFFNAGINNALEHFPAKWNPVRRRKCDQEKNLDHVPITRDRNMV